jgi:hypothetical protein
MEQLFMCDAVAIKWNEFWTRDSLRLHFSHCVIHDVKEMGYVSILEMFV